MELKARAIVHQVAPQVSGKALVDLGVQRDGSNDFESTITVVVNESFVPDFLDMKEGKGEVTVTITSIDPAESLPGPVDPQSTTGTQHPVSE